MQKEKYNHHDPCSDYITDIFYDTKYFIKSDFDY